MLSWLLSVRKGDASAELQMAMPLPSALTAENGIWGTMTRFLSMKAPGKSSRESGSTWSGTWVVVIDVGKARRREQAESSLSVCWRLL